ncbi:hypothetical protein KC19_12G004900 [Ceratodon purpureus]|uniref:Uncharacterized protein n=1 Tax=Ceratodon purpureus TaxID=3225 RepID=A0A8T0G214_CERPU|nr:hypothetical protein KC19_12G004900 [Ceratodon purpureus]
MVQMPPPLILPLTFTTYISDHISLRNDSKLHECPRRNSSRWVGGCVRARSNFMATAMAMTSSANTKRGSNQCNLFPPRRLRVGNRNRNRNRNRNPTVTRTCSFGRWTQHVDVCVMERSNPLSEAL